MKTFNHLTRAHLLRIVCLYTGMALLTSSSNAANLLTNGDFEKTTADGIDGWKQKEGPNEVPLASQDAGFMRGKTSLHLKSEKQVYVKSVPVSSVEGGKFYTISFFSKSPNAGQNIRVFFWGTGDNKKDFTKSKVFVTSTEWSKYEFTQKIPDLKDWVNPKFSVRIDVLAGGEAYFDDVSFEQATASAVQSPYDAPPRKNLLNNPGFEIGWLGWYVYEGSERKQSDQIGTFIDSKFKYEGVSSLKLEPNVIVCSQRYPIEPKENYTVSFYMRAERATGDGSKAAVMFMNGGPQPVLQKKELEVGKDVGAEWKRFSITFAFPEEANAYRNTAFIRIDSHDNNVWIDGVQFEKGDKATPYECGLQAGILMDSQTGLFTKGKAEDVKILINGTRGIPDAMILDMTARDVYSNVFWQAKLPLSATKNDLVTIPYTLKNDKLGVTEVSLEIKKGDEILSRNRNRYCVIDSTPENTKVNPYFGTWVYRLGPIWWENYNLDMCKFAGSGLDDTNPYWTPSKSNPNDLGFDQVRDRLMRRKSRGKITVGYIGNNPPPGQPKFLGNIDFANEIPTDEQIKASCEMYGKYCETFAKGVGETLDYINVLGEVNIMRVKSGKNKGMMVYPPERVIKFIKAGSDAIRKANPHAKVVVGVNMLNDFDYYEALFKLGYAKLVDAFAVDAYQSTAESPAVYETGQKLRTEIIDKYAKGMPLMNIEQYFGLRDLAIRTEEDTRDYYCDSEEDHTGRILQTGLHYVALDAPFCMYRTELTLFNHGLSGPTHFYFSYGGYRFMSQILHDIAHSSSPSIHPSVRTFYFERKDGTRIVTLNTKAFGKKGGIRNTGADQAFDVNGNPIDPANVSLGYLPVYLFYKESENEIVSKLKSSDIYGIDSPIQVAFEVNKSTLQMKVENQSSKAVNGTLTINKFPSDWKTPDPISLKSLAPKSSQQINIDIPTPFDWEKDYTIGYTVATDENVVQRRTKLPSIFAPHKSITIDGDLSDWAGIKFMNVGEKHILPGKGTKLDYKGTSDLSASAAVSWDENNIYLAVNVTDDHFVPEDKGIGFLNDSIQVYFDMQNEGSDGYDDNDSVYCLHMAKGKAVAELEQAPTGYFVGDSNAHTGIDINVKVSLKQTPTGYIYEAAFPRSALAFIKNNEGSQFGFSFMVNDNDGNDKYQCLPLGTVTPYAKPRTWKTIRLMGN